VIEYIEKSAGQPARKSPDPAGGSWINVEAPTKIELHALAERFNLDRGNLRDALDGGEVPRFEKRGRVSYIFLRYAYAKSSGETGTAPLLIVVGTGGLITISPAHLGGLDKLLSSDSTADTVRPDELALLLLDRIYDDFDFFIRGTAHRIQEAVSKMSKHQLENEDFVGFVNVEEELNDFLGALTPATAVLRRAQTGRGLALDKAGQDSLDDILLGIEQSINSCNSNLRRIVSVREAYSTLSNNSLNRSMKTLTAATLLIALPNVVFGMYGMNIALPFQHKIWAYALIVGGTLFVVLLIFVVARWRKWF
jgi:magnesium transporter